MSKYYQLILLGDTGCEACRKVHEQFFELLNVRIRGRFSDPFLFAVKDAVDDSVRYSGESGKLAETCGMASDFRRLIFSGSVWQYE